MAPTANSLRRALKRARDGVTLDVAEAAVLLQARDENLVDLAASAARVRDAGLEAAGRPGVITYSKSVFIPLTRLCRDTCHYCTFVTIPGKLRRADHGMFLSPDEVLDIARKGATLGCKEALITLGDKPEDRWPEAREWLDAHGYDDTLAYVRAISVRVLEETGLLPHLNPGVLTWTDFQRLKPVAPSMGMMLETTATRLWSEPGGFTYIVTRNINFTNVCYTGCRFCAFAQRRTDADAYTLSLDQVADRAQQAWDVGAVEVCMQGGIHPDLPGTAYFDIARAVKSRVPGMHVHAFSPMEVVNGATRTGLSIREWLTAAKEAGLDSVPGTAAEILDDEVRWVLTKGKLPAATWIEVITTAHEVGIRSSSTMMYGHVDQPRHWLGHLRTLARIQERTGGFTEFVTLPFVHTNAPVYLAGISRPGPTVRDNRAVTAMARLLLHPHIPNIQTSWVKLGAEGAADMLRSGANDLGGTLMEETISRMAGSSYGSYKSVRDLVSVAEAAGRPARPRTTLYGEVPEERRRAADASDGHLPELLPVLDA
nr:5-amino-6-(D-ribitylamino)uracil--L-tyrosine 4-hydroxyphenyl transferase CofH [Streptomyces antimycoticus]WTB11287.1 5-amino-6-(D-ribitylamino)uracil--L-tyrosine 4-hydroxyphenyl transferase CofH [Streptomyces antimycoticus]